MSCSFARKKDDIETLRKLLCWPEAEVAVPTADAAGGGEKLMASRSQQSSAKATRTRSPLSQPISKPSEHHSG
jgi:hypothetical protein